MIEDSRQSREIIGDSNRKKKRHNRAAPTILIYSRHHSMGPTHLWDGPYSGTHGYGLHTIFYSSHSHGITRHRPGPSETVPLTQLSTANIRQATPKTGYTPSDSDFGEGDRGSLGPSGVVE
jgi:hypothetical protein